MARDLWRRAAERQPDAQSWHSASAALQPMTGRGLSLAQVWETAAGAGVEAESPPTRAPS